MRLVLLTQDDPFYLPTIYRYLIPKLKNAGHEVPAAILFDVAPFGKKKSKIKQLVETNNVFGTKFVVYYILSYFKSLFNGNIESVLNSYGVKLVKLKNKINHSDSLNIVNSLRPDLLVSIAGNEIFKKPLFETSKYGIINLHSALLPKYRGLMPSFWVMRFNEEKTGVSVFFVDEGIDSGPIIIQEEVAIVNKTQAELIWELKYKGADAIVEACNLIALYGHKTPTIPNKESEKTYFSKPTKKDVQAFKANGKKFF
jgi:methionyl-tRNA formyltransferase